MLRNAKYRDVDRRLAVLESAVAAELELRQDVHDLTWMQLTQEQRALVNAFARKNEDRGYPIELGRLHCSAPPAWATADELAAALVYEQVYFRLYRQHGGRYAPEANA